MTVTHHGSHRVSIEMVDGCGEEDKVNFTHKTLGVKIMMTQARRGKSAVPGVTTPTIRTNL